MFSKVTDDFEYLWLQLDTLGCFSGRPALEVRSSTKGKTFALFLTPQIVLCTKKGKQNQQPLEKSKPQILG